MNWLPESRTNELAARLLADQPDPPRTVTVAQLLSVNFLTFAILLPLPILFAVIVGIAQRSIAWGLVVSVAGLGLVCLAASQRFVRARTALQRGITARAEVVGAASSKVVTLRLDTSPETQVIYNPPPDLDPGDIVQVMVDPQTRQVLLILDVLEPGPDYEPPRGSRSTP